MGGWTTPFCVNSTLPAGSRRYIFSHDRGEKTAPENSFQPRKKFRLHSVGETELSISLWLRGSVAKSGSGLESIMLEMPRRLFKLLWVSAALMTACPEQAAQEFDAVITIQD